MGAAFTPRDQRVRDAIRNDLDANMMVEAGAGTGKTTVMLDRIVNLLASGKARVEDIAVMTFTEKAAAELAGRVRQGLDDALARASGDARERIDAAIRGLNHAHIETIHAFAASLLRERPVEAGLDPGFEVLDEFPAQIDFEEAYDEWLRAQMAADEPPSALVDALEVGLRFESVREAAEMLHRHRDLMPLPRYAKEAFDEDAFFDEFTRTAAKLRSLHSQALTENGAYTESVRMCALFDDLRALRASGGSLWYVIVSAERPKKSKLGNQSEWSSADACRQTKAMLTDTRDLLDAATRQLRTSAMAELVVWLQQFVLEYESQRRAGGKADFGDLLLWSRNLLRDDREVRGYFQRKYRHIFVDEFQDTDPLQVEIVVYLCEEGQGAGDWHEAKLRPGSLFVVGDPKQSIYRFRRADIGVYDTVRTALFDGKPREIVQNFRSVEPIIGWVNRVFEQLVVGHPGVQAAYAALEAKRDVPCDGSPLIVIRREDDGAKPAADDLRRIEADAIAGALLRHIGDGGWRVRGEDGGLREATYRDVAVLIPSRTKLEIYEEALARAGIPYRHEGGRAFFIRQEVRDLIGVLRAVDDPSDQVALIAALRSPAFACSDEDLFLYKIGGGRFDYLSVRDDDEGAVPAALRTLRRFSRLRHETGLPALVRAVLDETRLVEFAMLQPQGDQVAANLLKVIDQARTFVEARGTGLRGFARWLKENAERAENVFKGRVADEGDASISEETDDVVRILTVHAAKGLEFPIVIFANMNTDRVDRATAIADRAHRQLHIKLGKKEDHFTTPGFDAARSLEDQHADAEATRQLYVAATRARDHLVVPIVAPPKSDPKTFNDWLQRAGAHEVDETIDTRSLPQLGEEAPLWAYRSRDVDSRGIDEVLREREVWQASHARLLEDAAQGLRVVTATGLKPEWERPWDGDGGVRRGMAREFGSAVHALLERIDLGGPETVPALAAVIAVEFGMQERAGEIEQCARNVLGHDVMARARRSRRVLREVPFTARVPDGRGLAEGQIDLLFEEDGGLVIVDFKTDAVREAEVAERAGVYHNQALVYAWAAQRATGVRPREVIFLFARPNVAHAIPVDDALLAEAEQLVREGNAVADGAY